MITGFLNNLNYTPYPIEKHKRKHADGESVKVLAVLLWTRLEFVTQTHKKRSGNFIFSFTFTFYLCITIRAQKEYYTPPPPDFNNKRWSCWIENKGIIRGKYKLSLEHNRV